MGNKETKYAHSITSPIICDSCAFSFCTFSRQINIRLASFHSRTKERTNSKIMLSPTKLISFSTFAVRYATFMAVISTADCLVNHKRNYLKKKNKKTSSNLSQRFHDEKNLSPNHSNFRKTSFLWRKCDTKTPFTLKFTMILLTNRYTES